MAGGRSGGAAAIGGGTGGAGSSGTGGNGNGAGAGGSNDATTRPCDIYASGTTPCVAAHSTVRAPYGADVGNLYQVRRASDNTVQDVARAPAASPTR
jgi:hypothetical protein